MYIHKYWLPGAQYDLEVKLGLERVYVEGRYELLRSQEDRVLRYDEPELDEDDDDDDDEEDEEDEETEDDGLDEFRQNLDVEPEEKLYLDE